MHALIASRLRSIQFGGPSRRLGATN